MIRRSKRLLAVAAVAAAVSALVPTSGAVAALGPCQAKDVAKVQEWSHTVAVTGEYHAVGALDVRLTCGIVQNGATVWSTTDPLAGPVAALAAVTEVQGQNYTVCYEIVTLRANLTTTTNDTCP